MANFYRFKWRFQDWGVGARIRNQQSSTSFTQGATSISLWLALAHVRADLHDHEQTDEDNGFLVATVSTARRSGDLGTRELDNLSVTMRAIRAAELDHDPKSVPLLRPAPGSKTSSTSPA